MSNEQRNTIVCLFDFFTLDILWQGCIEHSLGQFSISNSARTKNPFPQRKDVESPI